MRTSTPVIERMDHHWKSPDGELLHTARLTAGLDFAEAARLCGVDETYYRKMEAGKVKMRLSIYRLMLCRAGYLIDPNWEGWAIRQGRIWSPDGTGLTPGDVLSINWLDQSVRTLRAELYQKTGQQYDQSWFHGYHIRSSDS